MKIWLLLLLTFPVSILSAQDFWHPTNQFNAWQIHASFVTSKNNILVGTTLGGIYSSTDDGLTWVQSNHGLSNNDIRSFAEDSAGNLYAGSNGGGIFISTDQGKDWAQEGSTFWLNGLAITSLAVDTAGHIYALDGGGLCSFSKGQTNWNFFPIDNSISALAVQPNGIVFIAAYGKVVWHSTNQGKSWTIDSNGIGLRQISTLGIDAKGDVLAGTLDSLYEWMYDSSQWQVVVGFSTTATVTALKIKDTEIYAGMDNGEIYRSLDNGVRWEDKGAAFQDTVYSLSINSQGELYTSTLNDIDKIADSLQSWVNINPHFIGNYKFSSLAINSKGTVFIASTTSFAEDDLFFKSTNEGATWDTISTLSPTSLIIDNKDQIYAGLGDGIYKSSDEGKNWELLAYIDAYLGMSFDYSPRGYIYATAETIGDGSLERSTDGGITWQDLDRNRFMSGGAVAVDESEYIYTLAAGSYWILRSKDNGQSWEWIPIDSTFLYSLHAPFFDPKGCTFIPVGDRLYRTSDHGDTWVNVNSNIGINTSFVVRKNGDILAAGSGAFISND